MSAAEMGGSTIMLGNVQYYSNLNKKNVRKWKMPSQGKNNNNKKIMNIHRSYTQAKENGPQRNEQILEW